MQPVKGASHVMLVVRNLPADAGDIGDLGLIPGSGRSPGGGHGNPLQYSCLENPVDRGAWWATVHGVAQSQTRLSLHAAHDGVRVQPRPGQMIYLQLSLGLGRI